MSIFLNKIVKISLVSSTVIFLSSCAVQPEPITLEQHMQRAEKDFSDIYKNVAPLEGKLTLSNAISRGLMFNLDNRMIMMEKVLQRGQLSLANFNMLPRLAANAGYRSRDKFSASRSVGLNTGATSLQDSYSEEKNVYNADLSVSWNLLDFGLGYYQAKQQADRVMVAVERRRKVMNNMVTEIMIAYWKAVSAEQLLPSVDRLLRDVNSALAKSKTVEKRGLESPMATLEYRKNLLQTVAQLKQLRGEMLIAKAQLASLINLRPGQKFTLAQPSYKEKKLPRIRKSIKDFQKYGLAYRPELREEGYQSRIDEKNISKEMLKMFPSLSIIGSSNYNSNQFLRYQNWQEFTTQANWNLINVLQGPTAIKAAKTQMKIGDLRRLALSAAILGQVSISYTQYNQSLDRFKTASQLSNIERKMLKIAEDQASVDQGTELDRIQRKARSIASKLDKNRALIDAKTSLYNLMASVGADFVSADLETNSLEEVDRTVATSLRKLDEANISNWIQLPSMKPKLKKTNVKSTKKLKGKAKLKEKKKVEKTNVKDKSNSTKLTRVEKRALDKEGLKKRTPIRLVDSEFNKMFSTEYEKRFN